MYFHDSQSGTFLRIYFIADKCIFPWKNCNFRSSSKKDPSLKYQFSCQIRTKTEAVNWEILNLLGSHKLQQVHRKKEKKCPTFNPTHIFFGQLIQFRRRETICTASYTVFTHIKVENRKNFAKLLKIVYEYIKGDLDWKKLPKDPQKETLVTCRKTLKMFHS